MARIEHSCWRGHLTGEVRADQVDGDEGLCILRARERFGAREEREKPRDRDDREGGSVRGDGRRTTTITLKAVRDTPAMVLICRPRFPSPRCHGFHGVLVIIRTFRPPSTFARVDLRLHRRLCLLCRFLRHLFPPPPPPFPPLDAHLHPRRYLAARASGRRLVYLITGM